MDYGRLSTLYYDLSKPFPPKAEFDFYLRELKSVKNRVLEPMCGSGRFLCPLLKMGINIEGFDRSQHMIQACTSHLSDAKLIAKVLRSDFNKYSPNSKYGAVIITSGSFGLLKCDEEQRLALEKILSWLERDGFLLMEVETPAALSIAGKWEGNTYSVAEGLKIAISGTYVTTTSGYTNHILYSLMKNGVLLEQEQESFEMNLMTHKSAVELLRDVGFERIETFPPYDKSRSVNSKDPSFIVRAQKS